MPRTHSYITNVVFEGKAIESNEEIEDKAKMISSLRAKMELVISKKLKYS